MDRDGYIRSPFPFHESSNHSKIPSQGLGNFKMEKGTKIIIISLLITFLCLSLLDILNAQSNNYCDSLSLYNIQLVKRDQSGNVLSTVVYRMDKVCPQTFPLSSQTDSLNSNGFLFRMYGENISVVAATNAFQCVYFTHEQGNDSTSEKMFSTVIQQIISSSSNGSVSGLLAKLFSICHSAPVLYLSNDERLSLSFEHIGTLGIPSFQKEKKLMLVQVFDLSGHLLASSQDDIKISSLQKGLYLKVSSFSDGQKESRKYYN